MTWNHFRSHLYGAMRMIHSASYKPTMYAQVCIHIPVETKFRYVWRKKITEILFVLDHAERMNENIKLWLFTSGSNGPGAK